MEPGEARLISSATLFASDIDTPSTELMYILESVPSEGQLQLKVGVIKCDWILCCYVITEILWLQWRKRVLDRCNF